MFCTKQNKIHPILHSTNTSSVSLIRQVTLTDEWSNLEGCFIHSVDSYNHECFITPGLADYLYREPEKHHILLLPVALP